MVNEHYPRTIGSRLNRLDQPVPPTLHRLTLEPLERSQLSGWLSSSALSSCCLCHRGCGPGMVIEAPYTTRRVQTR
jgi:hypothetical protein